MLLLWLQIKWMNSKFKGTSYKLEPEQIDICYEMSWAATVGVKLD